MPEPVIIIRASSNEKGSGRDLALMKEVDRHPERWDFAFEEIELDLLFRLGDREIRWELKTPADWLHSAQTGHLAVQRMQAASYSRPACIAVLGSNMNVLDYIRQDHGPFKCANQAEMDSWEAAIERWEATCFASGFPVHYFHGSLDNSMRRICKWARAYLLEDTDGLPRPKAESWSKWCLLGLRNVGPGRADALLDQGIRPCLKTATGDDVLLVEDLLAPGVGKKTAKSILKEIGVI